jgi:hypothetical protein
MPESLAARIGGIEMRRNDFFKTAISCLAFLAIFAATCGTGLAQKANPKTERESLNLRPQPQAADHTDEDEKLDDKFRKFGSAAGAAYQCTPESEREKLVSDVRRAYTRIGQLFGTDRAFYFAVHFGHATDGPFDKAKCPELLKKLRESILVRRAAQ